MAWDVMISKTAEERLNNLPQDVQDRIKIKLKNEVSENPDRHLESLENSPYSRIRIGEYRVIVKPLEKRREFRIHDVGHRSSIYDR